MAVTQSPSCPQMHRVGEQPLRRREQLGPQRADADEGAGGELEVLGDPAAEHQPGGDVVRVGERDGVPGAEEALLVERGRGQVGPAVVARA